MSFSISRPGTLGGYNNTNMGFDYMPRAPQHMHAYFSTPHNPRGVVSQEQFLQKVAQAPQPSKEPEIKISSGMKIPSLAVDMLAQESNKKSKVTSSVNKSIAKDTPVSDDDSEDETLNIVAKGPNLSQLLREHQLLIKYTRGDVVVKRIKHSLKKGAYNRFVKFKVGKKLPYSPQYYLDEELTEFKGYLNNELLRVNILQQLADWANAESSEDSEEDSEETSEEEEEVEDEGNNDEDQPEEEHSDTDGSKETIDVVIAEEDSESDD